MIDTLYKISSLENLTRKTKTLLYNAGYLIPNGTVSSTIEEDWNYLTFGVGTNQNSDRMAFLVFKNFSINGNKIKYQGIELEYNANSKTLRVINNGGNLYFIEQHSSLT